MSDLYNRIESLCEKKDISVTAMCKEAGVSRASLSDLKAGRKQRLSAGTLDKIAGFFGTTVDFLLGRAPEDTAPAHPGKGNVSDEDIKFALFGGDGEITDAMYAEVRSFAAYVKQREAQKNRKE